MRSISGILLSNAVKELQLSSLWTVGVSFPSHPAWTEGRLRSWTCSLSAVFLVCWDRPGGVFDPAFMVSPLAWTTSTSRPPFLSSKPISTSPGWKKTHFLTALMKTLTSAWINKNRLSWKTMFKDLFKDPGSPPDWPWLETWNPKKLLCSVVESESRLLFSPLWHTGELGSRSGDSLLQLVSLMLGQGCWPAAREESDPAKGGGQSCGAASAPTFPL